MHERDSLVNLGDIGDGGVETVGCEMEVGAPGGWVQKGLFWFPPE